MYLCLLDTGVVAIEGRKEGGLCRPADRKQGSGGEAHSLTDGERLTDCGMVESHQGAGGRTDGRTDGRAKDLPIADREEKEEEA